MEGVSESREESPVKQQGQSCERFKEDSEATATTLQEFGQRYAAQRLSSIVLDSAHLVSSTIRQLDRDSQSVVRLLQEENHTLRESVASLVQRAAETAALVVAPAQNEDVVPTVSDCNIPMQLFNGHESVIQTLSATIEELARENASVRAQLLEYQTNYVPALHLQQCKEQLRQQDAALTATKAELVAAVVELEEYMTLNSAQQLRTDNEEHDVSRATRTKSKAGQGSGLSATELAECDPMWALAIRELEEQAVIAASQIRSREVVDAHTRAVADMEIKCGNLEVELSTAQTTISSMSKEYTVLEAQNAALMGQFVALLQTSQQLATQYQLMAERASSDRTSSVGIGLPQDIGIDRRGMQSVLEVRHFSQVVDASSVLVNAPVAQMSHTHASVVAHSPQPRSPFGSTYRRFTRDEIVASAAAHDIRSIEDIVKRNQRLLAHNTELELEVSQLKDLARKAAVVASEHGSDSSPKAKRSRQEGGAESRQNVLTSEVGTSTDAATELMSWYEQLQTRGSNKSVHVPESTVHSSNSASPSEAMYWSLLTQLLDVHQGFMSTVDQHITTWSGESARTAADALLRTTVLSTARAVRAEQETALAQGSYEEALEDLRVRDALNHHHLQHIATVVDRSLERTTREAVKEAPTRLAKSNAEATPADYSLWDSLLKILQSATAQEQLLAQLVRQAPARRSSVWQVGQAQAEGLQATIAELNAQLVVERNRVTVQAEQLHTEKLRHIETLERMWAAEQLAVETSDALKELRDGSGRQYSAEQYNQVLEELSLEQRKSADAQIALDEARSVAASHDALVQETTTIKNNEIKALRDSIGMLRTELSDARASVSLYQRQIREFEGALSNAQREVANAVQQADDAVGATHASQRMVEELKDAILSQTCTEQLLFSLFPDETSLEAVFARNRSLQQESVHLQQQIAARDAVIANLEQQAEISKNASRASQDQYEQVLVDLHMVRSVTSLQEGSAVRELPRLSLELEGLHTTIATLQRERDHLLKRESILEERITTLAADPISLNVRKYGVQRLKTIEEQMEELHSRCTSLQTSIDDVTSQRDNLASNLASLTEQLRNETTSKAALDAEVHALKNTVHARDNSITELTTEGRTLSSRVASLEAAELEATKALSDAKSELVGAAAELIAKAASERDTKMHADQLLKDNLLLMDQLKELTTVVNRVEAEHRTTKASLATQSNLLAAARSQRGAGGGGVTSSRKSATSFADARTWAPHQ